jgi:hypothetical protein
LDSQTIEVHELVKGLEVYLATFLDIMFEMDIVVIDVPDVWGMLMNIKVDIDLGGSLQRIYLMLLSLPHMEILLS